ARCGGGRAGAPPPRRGWCTGGSRGRGAVRAPPSPPRPHFSAAAAEARRRTLVEGPRRKAREKHGGGRRRVHPDLEVLQADGPAEEVLALHEALEKFAVADPLRAKLVELRFFGGLTLPQAPPRLGISPSTAHRRWRYARAWLYSTLAGADSADETANETPDEKS